MVDKNKVMDEVMRREKTRFIRRVLKYSGFILLFGAIYTFSEYKNYDRVKFEKEIAGVVESIQISTDENDQQNTLFKVKLETDKQVTIIQTKPAAYKQGDSVKVLREEYESGLKKYSFILESSL